VEFKQIFAEIMVVLWNTKKLLFMSCTLNQILFHRVQKHPATKELSIASVVLKVVARGNDSLAYFPCYPENEQNFAYLIVDPMNRQIITLVHHYGGTFQC
jgi:hypothetical protein